jgi:glycosyltransferase involved in cell wall biosynthesis
MPSSLSHIAILIPAWQPEVTLLALVDELVPYGFGAMVVVDDGSHAASQPIFAALDPARVTLVRHAVNLGKGRALKSGFNALLTGFPQITGVVTADADGQHTAADIVRVAMKLAETAQPVLGARGFDRDVPFRSRFGNTLTRYIFGFVTGAKLGDTQTGLRGLPTSLLPELMRLDGERYEYEMTMLAHLCREGRKPVEVPIATVYIDSNRGSHFDPLRDSMRIYFVLARFYFSSIVAAAIDLIGFSLTFAATHNLVLSVAVGRLSSLVNFALNRRFVFHSRQSVADALLRYYLLAAAIAGLSYLLLRSITTHTPANVYATKVAVDILLSLVSFSVQRTFVFNRRRKLAPLE